MEVIMQKILIAFCCLFFSCCSAANDWRNFWHKGIDLTIEGQFQGASLEFDRAINLMSEEELNLYPYVLISRADANSQLGDYSKVIQDTGIALKSKNLTEYERMICAMKRNAAFFFLGDDANSADTCEKYLQDSPLLSKRDFFKDKVIIRNIPDCQFYKEIERKRLIEKYCENDKDISDYGSMWIVNITKQKSD